MILSQKNNCNFFQFFFPGGWGLLEVQNSQMAKSQCHQFFSVKQNNAIVPTMEKKN